MSAQGNITITNTGSMGHIGNVGHNGNGKVLIGDETSTNIYPVKVEDQTRTNVNFNDNEATETSEKITKNRFSLLLEKMDECVKSPEAVHNFDVLASEFLVLTQMSFHKDFSGSLVHELRTQPEYSHLQTNEEIDNAILESFFSEIYPAFENLLINVYLERTDLKPLKTKTIVAPQGAGKGTQIRAIEESIRREKELGQSSVQLQKLLEVLENMNVITTGTNGIFNPKGEKRYDLYAPLGKVSGPIVDKGIMLSDSLTHTVVLIEMIRQALKGDTNNIVDTYPRTGTQYELFFNFLTQLNDRTGKDHTMYYVMMDLLEPDEIETIINNKEIALPISLELSKELIDLVASDPMISKLIVQKSLSLADQIEQANNVFPQLLDKLENLKDYKSQMTAKDDVKNAQIQVLINVVSRMKDRISKAKEIKDIRDDERSATSILARLSEYLRLTLPIALNYAEINIISAQQSPKSVSRDLLTDMCRAHGIDINDRQVIDFIERTGEIAEQIVHEQQPVA